MAKSVTPKAYDPVKAMEGMFNGSVTRIAYALKDPGNYGASTKMVLTEVAKRFHDALDDCEIQLLDAKWYLEHQLLQNRLKREAKARDIGTAAKRKHEEMEEKIPIPDETPTKKAKTEQGEPETAKKEGKPTMPAMSIDASKPLKLPENEKKEPAPAPHPEEQPSQDDFAKPTPQATPAATNDEFNFESMFGEPTADTGDNNDLNFDMGFDDGFNSGQDPSSLDALIPGLEDYANQPMETQHSNSGAAGDALPTFSNDFDLPDLGGTNDFDDFLNDGLQGGDLGGDANLNDQGLLDFNDSLFN